MKGGSIYYDTYFYAIKTKTKTKKDGTIAFKYNSLEADLFNLLLLICHSNKYVFDFETEDDNFVRANTIYNKASKWWHDVYTFMSSGQRILFLYLLRKNIEYRIEDYLENYKHTTPDAHFHPVDVRNRLLIAFSDPVNHEKAVEFYGVAYTDLPTHTSLTAEQTINKQQYIEERREFNEIVALHNYEIGKGIHHKDEIKRKETAFFIRYFRPYFTQHSVVDTYSIYCNKTIITDVMNNIEDKNKQEFIISLVEITQGLIESARTMPDAEDIIKKNIALHIEVRNNVIGMFVDPLDVSGVPGALLIGQYEMAIDSTKLSGLPMTPLTIVEESNKLKIQNILKKKKPKKNSLAAEEPSSPPKLQYSLSSDSHSSTPESPHTSPPTSPKLHTSPLTSPKSHTSPPTSPNTHTSAPPTSSKSHTSPPTSPNTHTSAPPTSPKSSKSHTPAKTSKSKSHTPAKTSKSKSHTPAKTSKSNSSEEFDFNAYKEEMKKAAAQSIDTSLAAVLGSTKKKKGKGGKRIKTKKRR